MKRLLSIIVLAALLAGCAGVPQVNSSTPAQALSKLTSADLTAAAAISTANGDTAGANCANALNTWLSSIAPPGEPTAQPAVIGAASAFAELRVHTRAAQDVVSQIQAGVPEPVHIACSPVVLDAQTTMLKLGVLIGGAQILVPLAPAVGAALPVPIR